ncbi:MAG: orotidine-5'-phosphate decarboxylase [Gammaproteobacteria bacterium]|jgi:orotidine-5'-phosphate decarboxylase|nr:orotidine-5'-phosphate decarboxylase [Gammaproteobacteria bacterium]MBK9466973.1 orotidine-5'-phosphate decarboxylase [Gammaproteobacteria bacterium]MBP6479466.1 orotidine-5'-phosphate decarboxylase [Pseudomonadales bacterium]MBP7909628.1 orotidine-5'-phosphate decarboxylase [Pseudomonadales bacterium]
MQSPSGSPDRSADAGPRIVVALDYATAAAALAMAGRLDPRRCRLKVGKELFTAAGPELVRSLVARGFEVFLDLKFHDIPNTVAGAVRAAAELGVWMVNVHAGGGRRMMQGARAALESLPGPRPLLIAVTVLTSMEADELAETGVNGGLEQQVLRLAGLALGCGLDGVVCSAREAPLLRSRFGAAPVLVTPGIRPASAAPDDQRRTLTPAEALAAGSDYLVVGRPITGAPDPGAALDAILSDISYRFS